MYTQCPDCATVYEITTEQLGAAGGLVSCGNCEATFNALRRLTSAPPQTEPEPPVENLQSELKFDAEDTISGKVELPAPEETAHGVEHTIVEAEDNSDGIDQDDDFDLDQINADDIEVIFDDADPGELEAREDLVDELLDDIDLLTSDDDLIITEYAGEASVENIDDNSLSTNEADEDEQLERSGADYEVDIEELIQKAEIEIGAIDDNKKIAADSGQDTGAEEDSPNKEDDSTKSDSSAENFVEIDNHSAEDWNTEDGEQVLEALLSDENLLEDDEDNDDEEAEPGDSLEDELVTDEQVEDTDLDDSSDEQASKDTTDEESSSDSQDNLSDSDDTDGDNVNSDAHDNASDEDTDTRDDDGNDEGIDAFENKSNAQEPSDVDRSEELEDDATDLADGEDNDASEARDEISDGKDSDFPEDDELAIEALDPVAASNLNADSDDIDSHDPGRDSATDAASNDSNILTQEVDGAFEQDINDAHDYRDLQRFLQPAKTLPRKIGEWIFVIALIAALGAQFVHQNRESLLDHPRFGEKIRDVYDRLGVSLIDHWDVTEYRVARHTVVPHSEDSNVLQARATIINSAASSRPVPLVRFELQNRWGDPIFSRTFTVDEYASAPSDEKMKPNGRLEIVLDLVNPTEDAVFNYNFDVCLQAKGQRVYCSADQVFTQK